MYFSDQRSLYLIPADFKSAETYATGTCLPKRMPPERACRNVCRRNMLAETYAAGTCLPEHTRRNMQTHSRPSTMFFLYNTNLSHGGAFEDCGLRKSGMRRAEYGFVLCGKYLSTLRKVLEYLPQSTLARSAFRRGASGTGGTPQGRGTEGKEESW